MTGVAQGAGESAWGPANGVTNVSSKTPTACTVILLVMLMLSPLVTVVPVLASGVVLPLVV